MWQERSRTRKETGRDTKAAENPGYKTIGFSVYVRNSSVTDPGHVPVCVRKSAEWTARTGCAPLKHCFKYLASHLPSTSQHLRKHFSSALEKCQTLNSPLRSFYFCLGGDPHVGGVSLLALLPHCSRRASIHAVCPR